MPITPRRFAQLVEPIEGLKISHAWRGAGSAIFLELGALTTHRGQRQPRGEAGVMIEWSWRIESARAVRAGSWSSPRRIENALAALTGLRVRRIQVEGRLPELDVELTGGRWLHSFTTVEGQPQWALFLRDRSWLFVDRGRVIHASPNQRSRKSARNGAV